MQKQGREDNAERQRRKVGTGLRKRKREQGTEIK